eukprot:gene5190-323_t
MPGYKAKIANCSEELSHLKCLKCGLLVRDPVQLNGGERICFTCCEGPEEKLRNGILLYNGSESLNGSAIGNDVAIFKDKHAKNEVDALNVYCSYKDSGCSWVGLIREFEAHVNSCEVYPELCQQCGCDVQRRQLERHLEEECTERIATCRFCEGKFQHGLLASHLKTCIKKPIACNQCQISMPPDQIKDHEDLWCEKTKTVCPFQEEGCKIDQIFDKKELSVHITDTLSFHILILLARLKALGRFIKEISTNLVNLKNDLYPRLERLSRLFQDIELKVLSWTNFLKAQLSKHWEEIQHVKRTVADNREELQTIVLQKDDEKKLLDDISCKIFIHESQLSEQIGAWTDFQKQVKTLTDRIEALRASQYELKLGHQRILGIGGSPNLPAPVYPSPGSPDYHISYNGELIWKISDITTKRQDAILKRTTSIISPPFFSKMHEYQLCGRLYPNGEGPAKGKFISLFFAIMKGPYDALLPWPFNKRITLSILDQEGVEHHEETFRADQTSSSFQRPQKDINIASGSPFFISLEALETHSYVVQDVMYIKIKIHED